MMPPRRTTTWRTLLEGIGGGGLLGREPLNDRIDRSRLVSSLVNVALPVGCAFWVILSLLSLAVLYSVFSGGSIANESTSMQMGLAAILVAFGLFAALAGQRLWERRVRSYTRRLLAINYARPIAPSALPEVRAALSDALALWGVHAWPSLWRVERVEIDAAVFGEQGLWRLVVTSGFEALGRAEQRFVLSHLLSAVAPATGESDELPPLTAAARDELALARTRDPVAGISALLKTWDCGDVLAWARPEEPPPRLVWADWASVDCAGRARALAEVGGIDAHAFFEAERVKRIPPDVPVEWNLSS